MAVDVDIVHVIKELSNLSQIRNSAELLRKLMALEQEVFILNHQNHQLRTRTQYLEDKLGFADDLEFRSPFYYCRGDETPYCQKCWEVDKVAVHLVATRWPNGEARYDCPNCSTSILGDEKGFALNRSL